jgi:hypothetical protein
MLHREVTVIDRKARFRFRVTVAAFVAYALSAFAQLAYVLFYMPPARDEAPFVIPTSHAPILVGHTDASRQIGGIRKAENGDVRTVCSDGSEPVIVKNNDERVPTSERIFLPGGQDMALAHRVCAMFAYDGLIERWYVFASGQRPALESAGLSPGAEIAPN